MAAHRMRGPCHDLLTDRGHLSTVTGNRLGRPSPTCSSPGLPRCRARGCAPRGLTQLELKTVWNTGLNDAARRHRGGIDIEGETKR